jgi:hypothetical protein
MTETCKGCGSDEPLCHYGWCESQPGIREHSEKLTALALRRNRLRVTGSTPEEAFGLGFRAFARLLADTLDCKPSVSIVIGVVEELDRTATMLDDSEEFHELEVLLQDTKAHLKGQLEELDEIRASVMNARAKIRIPLRRRLGLK